MSTASIQKEAGTVTARQFARLEEMILELRQRVDALTNSVDRIQNPAR